MTQIPCRIESRKKYVPPSLGERISWGLYRLRFHKEKPGVITPGFCWVIFEGPYMYGPCDNLRECVGIMLTEWRYDWHLVG